MPVLRDMLRASLLRCAGYELQQLVLLEPVSY